MLDMGDCHRHHRLRLGPSACFAGSSIGRTPRGHPEQGETVEAFIGGTVTNLVAGIV